MLKKKKKKCFLYNLGCDSSLLGQISSVAGVFQAPCPAQFPLPLVTPIENRPEFAVSKYRPCSQPHNSDRLGLMSKIFDALGQ